MRKEAPAPAPEKDREISKVRWSTRHKNIDSIGLPTLGGGSANARGLPVFNAATGEVIVVTPTATGAGRTYNSIPVYQGAPKPKH